MVPTTLYEGTVIMAMPPQVHIAPPPLHPPMLNPRHPIHPPATGYGAPDYDDAPSYGATSYGEPESPFDISTLIIPLLIIFGLSLLFPTTTTVEVDPAARRKRSASKKHTLYKKIL